MQNRWASSHTPICAHTGKKRHHLWKPLNSLDWSGLPCLPLPHNPCLGAVAGSSSSHLSLFLLQPAFSLPDHSWSAQGLPRRQRKALLVVLVATAFVLLTSYLLILIACWMGDGKRQSGKANPTQLPARMEVLSLSFCLLLQHHLQLRSHLPPHPPEEGCQKNL